MLSKFFKILLATIIFIAVIYWVEYKIGWLTVWQSWQHIHYTNLIFLIFLTFVSYLLRAYRIYYLFKQAKQSFWVYLHINLLHNALNNFLPMRLGEASFPLLMKRYFNSPLLHSTGGLIWLRVIDLHWLISSLLIVACFQFSPLYIALLLLWFLIPLYLYLSPLSLAKHPPKRFNNHWQNISKAIPKDLKTAVSTYLQTALIWSLKLLALTIVFLSFLKTDFFYALFGVISADISSVLPIHGFAGTGTFEAAMIGSVSPIIGYSNQLLLAAINVHIYLLLVSILSVPIALIIPTPKTTT